MIVPLGERVLRKACAEASARPGLRLAVNLSPVQFCRPGLADLVQRVLAETGLESCRLELEITEGVLLQDTDATLATLTAIRALGVRVAMDDFGMGCSSLSYLRRFPFGKVKIDRSSVAHLGAPDADAIVRAVISLGRPLGIKANAEGVETAGQAALLRAAGCEEAQGFHFSRPIPPAQVTALLHASNGEVPGPASPTRLRGSGQVPGRPLPGDGGATRSSDRAGTAPAGTARAAAGAVHRGRARPIVSRLAPEEGAL